MNTPHTPDKMELNSKDIRTVAYIMLAGVILVILCLFWAARSINAQEKTVTVTPSGSTFWAGTDFIAPPQDKPKVKATGITLHGCKSATVYLITQRGHILAPMWNDKATVIPGVNPVVCDYRGRVTFYVLPSQDYEIQVTKPEAR